MVGTLTNQNPARRARKACKAHKACKARMARMAHKARKARKGVGKNSIDLIGCGGDINQSESCKEGA